MILKLPRLSEEAGEIALERLQRKAADLHEKATKHHRAAALLYESGDRYQADAHASIARRHSMAALAAAAVPKT